MILTQQEERAKLSLIETLQKWIESEGSDIDCYKPDHLGELMANSAFSVLLACKDLESYFVEQDMLNDK